MTTAKLFGESNQLASQVSSSGYNNFLRFQAPVHGIAKKLYYYVGATGGKCKMALYSDSSGNPAIVLAQSAMTDVSANGWASLDISDVTIVSGSYYWLVCHTNCDIAYATTGGLARKYKAVTFSASYTFTDNPSGLTSDNYNLSMYCQGILTLAPSTIAPAFAAGSPRLIAIVAPAGIASLQAFGSPTVTRAGNYITPSGIASLEAFGSPAVINRQILAPSGVASAFASGSPAVVLHVQILAPPGIASAFAAGSPGLYQGNITCAGILSCEACGAVMVLRDRIHLILEGSYEIDSQEVNRSYVVGQDLSGAAVVASAITQAEVDLVGERLEVQHTPEAVTSAVAGYVAANVLAKARLGSKKGVITIPPHCGVELWDVVYIYDEYGNQSANYRVAAYVFEYSVLESRWQHQIELCAP